MNSEEDYKKQIATNLNKETKDLFLYWKGRVALYTLLKAIGVKAGDEVILPAFTCVVVPNAILYLKAKPVYIDIDPDSLNPTFSCLANAVTSKTKAIICQNTFGLSTDVDQIAAFGKEKRIFTIEDCTHGFGGNFNGKPNGTFCDAAFFSTQWNKPYSTGIGGFSLINTPELINKAAAINKNLIMPGIKDELFLYFLIKFKKHFLNTSNYWQLLKLYRFLSKHNLVLGSSSGTEILSTVMPANYFKGMGNIQIKEGIKNVSLISNIIKGRKETAKQYTELLSGLDKWHVKQEYFDNHSFLKYPILVNDRDRFMELAEKNKIQLGDWFCSVLHPVTENFHYWQMDPEKFPNANRISQLIVNLPTEAPPKKVLKFLSEYQEYIV